jgi:hypothetical protein
MHGFGSTSAQSKGGASRDEGPDNQDYNAYPDVPASHFADDLGPASPAASTNVMPSSEESIDPEFTQMVECEDCGVSVQYLQLGLHGPGVCPPPRQPSSARARPRITDPFAPSVLRTEHLQMVPAPTNLIAPPNFQAKPPRHSLPTSSGRHLLPEGNDPADLEEIQELGFSTRLMYQFKCSRCLTWQNSDSLYVHKHGFCEKAYEDSTSDRVTKRRRLEGRDTGSNYSGRAASRVKPKQEDGGYLTFSDGEEFLIPKDEED